MKTVLCLTLTLLIFVSLAFVTNSFAQDVSLQFVVRQIYFYPSDREPSNAVEAKLDAMTKNVQQFYADEMERHEFDRKTFTLETDENGRTVKHRLIGKLTSLDYFNNHNRARDEIFEHFGRPEHVIYLYLIDYGINGQDFSVTGNAATVGLFGGWASVRFGDFDKMTEDDFLHYARYVIAHELGHTFGLSHDFRKDRYIMSGGKPHLIDRLSHCAAKWLDASRYFNMTQNTSDQLPDIEMLEPTFVSPPNTIRLRFEITYTVGLHQAQLLINTGAGPQGIEDLALNNVTIIDCKSLSGNSETIEFVITKLRYISEYVDLKVIDVHGNFKRKRFPIDMSSLLPDTAFVPISIPDVNLEAKIREEIRLTTGRPITNLDMLNLIYLSAFGSQITDITGLEHAINLERLSLPNNQIADLTPLTELKSIKFLRLNNNQITDIGPLAGLTNLQELSLDRNQVSDITALTELTDLRHLRINQNQIADITALAKLTDLRHLRINQNQIADVGSLAKLKNLVELALSGHPISDISPLTKLTGLQELSLVGNQISDVRPFAELANLQMLALGGNQISDITSLAELTDLETLNLNANQISDVTPLAGLTNLQFLSLVDNQISDVNPLANSTSLERLYLVNNPIKNRKPLFALLRKNPDVKIYLRDWNTPLPVTLSSFLAESTEAGVVLKWTTESEVDNAGFYIYRSKTKDGEFKVVTPTMIKGAGTTGERNKYTWTDTTAKPNTVYYYRVEDVSHAGVSEQLATVRLRGLVSASGKFTTRWVDLKANRK